MYVSSFVIWPLTSLQRRETAIEMYVNSFVIWPLTSLQRRDSRALKCMSAVL